MPKNPPFFTQEVGLAGVQKAGKNMIVSIACRFAMLTFLFWARGVKEFRWVMPLECRARKCPGRGWELW